MEDAKTPWISVKDKRPDRVMMCLVVIDRSKYGKGHRFPYIASVGQNMRTGEFYFVVGNVPWESDWANDITHWMPIPKLPKEET